MNRVEMMMDSAPPPLALSDEERVLPFSKLDHSRDRTLIAKILAGDGEAFPALVRPYLPRFTVGIYRILQDDQDTQDILHIALSAIHTELYRFPERRTFSTWAYRLCLEEALVQRRSRMRRREDILREYMPYVSMNDHLSNQDAARGLGAERCATQQQDDSRLQLNIRIGLTHLSDDPRRVFILRDLDGLNTDDVARAMGISRQLVRQYLQQARACLRSVLANSIKNEAMA